jgi:hypothetical protein
MTKSSDFKHRFSRFSIHDHSRDCKMLIGKADNGFDNEETKITGCCGGVTMLVVT